MLSGLCYLKVSKFDESREIISKGLAELRRRASSQIRLTMVNPALIDNKVLPFVGKIHFELPLSLLEQK